MDNINKIRFNVANLNLLLAIYKLFAHKFLKTKSLLQDFPAFLRVNP